MPGPAPDRLAPATPARHDGGPRQPASAPDYAAYRISGGEMVHQPCGAIFDVIDARGVVAFTASHDAECPAVLAGDGAAPAGQARLTPGRPSRLRAAPPAPGSQPGRAARAASRARQATDDFAHAITLEAATGSSLEEAARQGGHIAGALAGTLAIIALQAGADDASWHLHAAGRLAAAAGRQASHTAGLLQARPRKNPPPCRPRATSPVMSAPPRHETGTGPASRPATPARRRTSPPTPARTCSCSSPSRQAATSPPARRHHPARPVPARRVHARRASPRRRPGHRPHGRAAGHPAPQRALRRWRRRRRGMGRAWARRPRRLRRRPLPLAAGPGPPIRVALHPALRAATALTRASMTALAFPGSRHHSPGRRPAGRPPRPPAAGSLAGSVMPAPDPAPRDAARWPASPPRRA